MVLFIKWIFIIFVVILLIYILLSVLDKRKLKKADRLKNFIKKIESYKKMSKDELNGLSDNDLFEFASISVLNSKVSGKKLNGPSKNVYNVVVLEKCLKEKGFYNYFKQNSDKHIDEIYSFLKLIGANSHANIVKLASKLYSSSKSEEDIFGELDKSYYLVNSGEKLEDLIAKYVKDNVGYFEN